MENKTIKVLHLLPSNSFSGAENVICQIVEIFRGSKEYSMIYCSPDGPIRKSLADRNVEFLPLKDFSVRSVRYAIQAHCPDVIHAHDVRACVMAALCSGRTPVIFHIHNNWFGVKKLNSKSIMLLLASIKAKHIYWVSKSSLMCYPYKHLVNRKSSVLVNMIDPHKLMQQMRQDSQQYDYDIVFIGRLTYQKNPQRLLNVLARIATKKIDVKVGIIGTGELSDELKQLAVEKGIHENVHFLGFQNNPYKILYDSKLMLMTSRWEGTPICVLEAMALGVPVVSTPADGICDLIESGKNGYLSDDDDQLAEYALSLLRNPRAQQRMRTEQLAKANSVNDKKNYKNILIEQYR